MPTIAFGIVLGVALLYLIPIDLALIIAMLMSKTFWKVVGFSILAIFIISLLAK